MSRLCSNFESILFDFYIYRKDLLRRNKIPLPIDEARCLFGIADETKLLKEGQCFIQYQTADKKSYKIVTGTRLPSIYD